MGGGGCSEVGKVWVVSQVREEKNILVTIVLREKLVETFLFRWS